MLNDLAGFAPPGKPFPPSGEFILTALWCVFSFGLFFLVCVFVFCLCLGLFLVFFVLGVLFGFWLIVTVHRTMYRSSTSLLLRPLCTPNRSGNIRKHQKPQQTKTASPTWVHWSLSAIGKIFTHFTLRVQGNPVGSHFSLFVKTYHPVTTLHSECSVQYPAPNELH